MKSSQFMLVQEPSYAGTATMNRAIEHVDETFVPRVGRIEVGTRRPGSAVQRGDRTIPWLDGASGRLTAPVLTRGHAILLHNATGTSAVAGPTDLAYTWTFTIVEGSLTGKSLGGQADRPFAASGASQAFTWRGGKITDAEWTMKAGPNGYLMGAYQFDWAQQVTDVALAAPTYPANTTPLPWVLSQGTLNGAAVEIEECKIKLTNPLKMDRRALRNNSLKKEPLEAGDRMIEVTMSIAFDNLTHYNRVVATTQAGASTAFALTCTGPTLIGTTTFPSCTFNIPELMFNDVADVVVDDDDPIVANFTAKATFNGTNNPMTITYVTLDAAL